MVLELPVIDLEADTEAESNLVDDRDADTVAEPNLVEDRDNSVPDESDLVDDRDDSVPDAVKAQTAASVPSEGLACLPESSRFLRVPADHDKLQSIANLSSAKPDQALISFKSFI